ncbi:hypothetical protein CEXT_169121 [Caerostris extrusa]|uniref:Uncharacterized protein n=1 Tax=Caerostris extrusa TaxID=172846 RepID=A0AAV4S534_CAEEX|nr:hypothetical protein CEXT_169121 [Caerostris extrusa]
MLWEECFAMDYQVGDSPWKTIRAANPYHPKVKSDNWYMNFGDQEKDYDLKTTPLLEKDTTKSTYERLMCDYPNFPKPKRYVSAAPIKRLVTDEFRYQSCPRCGNLGIKV